MHGQHNIKRKCSCALMAWTGKTFTILHGLFLNVMQTASYMLWVVNRVPETKPTCTEGLGLVFLWLKCWVVKVVPVLIWAPCHEGVWETNVVLGKLLVSSREGVGWSASPPDGCCLGERAPRLRVSKTVWSLDSRINVLTELLQLPDEVVFR